MDEAPEFADPVPVIAVLIPRDPAWERVVAHGLGMRLLPWHRAPRYRRAGAVPAEPPPALAAIPRRPLALPTETPSVVH